MGTCGGVWIGDDNRAGPLKWNHVVYALRGLTRAPQVTPRPLLSSKTTRNRIIQASVVKTLSDYHRSLRTGVDGLLSSVVLKRQLVKDQDY